MTRFLERIGLRKPAPLSVSDYQAEVDSGFVAKALLDYHKECRRFYPFEVRYRIFGAVGPIHTFIGWLVKTGRISINTQQE